MNFSWLLKRNYVAGNTEQAIEKYESVQALNQAYEHDQVVRHLYELYLASGQEIINLKPANLELLPAGINLFYQSPGAATSQRRQRVGSSNWLNSSLKDRAYSIRMNGMLPSASCRLFMTHVRDIWIIRWSNCSMMPMSAAEMNIKD